MPAINYEASPTLSRFHRSNAFVRGIVGPMGSGKSTGNCIEIFVKSCQQEPWREEDDQPKVRKTRWAVVRNTYRELADTTVKTWLDWFGHLGTMDEQDMVFTLSYDLPDNTKVIAEVLFRALDLPKDVKKLLSLDLTGAWVNEAKEVPRGVIDMLQGRVGRYPAMRHGGPTWHGVMLDTNPPDTDHWWYDLFEEQKLEGWEVFKQPGGRSEHAENTQHLPPGYYHRLAIGKKAEWVKVYVDGEYGFVVEGKPVHGSFVDSAHVAREPFGLIDGDIFVGLDFGLTPAAIFGQKTVSGQWRIPFELVTENMGVKRFAEEFKRFVAAKMPNRNLIIWGDPAGNQRQAGADEEETVFQLLAANGVTASPCTTNDFTMRTEAMDQCLQRMIDGEPGILISPACKTLRKGLGGGYCLKRVEVAGEERYRDKPVKDKYSHPVEAGHYMLLGAGEGTNIMVGSGNANDYKFSRTTPSGRRAGGWKTA